jgi:hypothetical protein
MINHAETIQKCGTKVTGITPVISNMDVSFNVHSH